MKQKCSKILHKKESARVYIDPIYGNKEPNEIIAASDPSLYRLINTTRWVSVFPAQPCVSLLWELWMAIVLATLFLWFSALYTSDLVISCNINLTEPNLTGSINCQEWIVRQCLELIFVAIASSTNNNGSNLFVVWLLTSKQAGKVKSGHALSHPIFSKLIDSTVEYLFER